MLEGLNITVNTDNPAVSDSTLSDEFVKAVLKEMENLLSNFKENFEWVEREDIVTRKYKDLECKY